MPLVHGYSREAIGENIRRERRKGRSAEQSAAIAYSTARRAWRGRHRRGRLPRGLLRRSNPATSPLVLLALGGAALWLITRKQEP